MSAMRIAMLATCLAGIVTIAEPGAVAQAAARCAADGVHASAIAGAREHVRQACPCNIPKSSGEYLRCAARIIDRDIADRLLPGQCAGQVRSWASRSVCGRDDAVVCCVKRERGPWRPQVRAGEASCRAPRAGEACVANYPHVDDACLGDAGCWQNRCGDGVIGPLSGEECEPRVPRAARRSAGSTVAATAWSIRARPARPRGRRAAARCARWRAAATACST